MTAPRLPVPLGPNQPDRPYRGGAGIAALRGAPQTDEYAPEDFVGSTTEIFAGGGVGLSRLPDGTVLRDAVAEDPAGWLGAAHVAMFGASTELLVKLLDTGERLFVHFHPDGRFAGEHLGLAHGKTEAWIVVATVDDLPVPAHLGFRRPVTAAEVDGWVDSQDVSALLAALHPVDLVAGTTLFVPAGLPHAIGAGVTLVELQEPTDLSVLLEYAGFTGLSLDDAFLGLERAVALSALERAALGPAALAGLVSGARPGDRAGVTRLFGAEADRFFRAERLEPAGGAVPLHAGYSILVVLDGAGMLHADAGPTAVRRGDTLLLPYALGDAELTGEVTAIRCRPPAPS